MDRSSVAPCRRDGRETLRRALVEARQRTLAMVAGLDDAQWRVPRLAIINPPLWELGHVGWFQEYWCLRRDRAGTIGSPLRADADRLYDSRHVAHPTRWSLPLPDAAQTRDELASILERTLATLDHAGDDDDSLYFHRLALFHELMHEEAFAYTWQTLGYREARVMAAPMAVAPPARELEVPPGQVVIGADPHDHGFVFDNEKWAHEETVDGFGIDAVPTSCARFAEFVADGGYADPRWWSAPAFEALRRDGRSMPRDWRRDGDVFEIRRFEDWQVLEPAQPVWRVSAFEAEAFCRWAGRALPTEAQWLRAARTAPGFRWGQVWEWTASRFEPLPGFSPDPYAEYSAPWFGGTHRVVRGASFATPADLIDLRFRNFYEPHRDDPFIGFRTCAPRR